LSSATPIVSSAISLNATTPAFSFSWGAVGSSPLCRDLALLAAIQAASVLFSLLSLPSSPVPLAFLLFSFVLLLVGSFCFCASCSFCLRSFSSFFSVVFFFALPALFSLSLVFFRASFFPFLSLFVFWLALFFFSFSLLA
jgi:Predicted nucleoside-diphosphate sugar epimerases